MEKKVMALILIMTLIVTVLPGITLAAGNDSHGSGSSHGTGDKNVKVNPNNNTQPVETHSGQEMTGNMTPMESHETADDHGGGGHGTKITERNYALLYVFLVINLAVLAIAGFLKYSRRTVVA
ncbi:hypothetical protein BR63_10815 [Thermanaerosceptrum fracticalcis]|uniref:Uncharacterized protein n=1 Tax=Thermanaerosceptrum fracticalcis TaxID=1712410 RepID=A0A7G6E3V0_THEFR|nr:hypothetical protein [Thermanaerosceptrum fracticalcis]QNB46754.1 hypothetical protein BR63_10815 [Thermanaerosceptrum fracticalcis]